MSPPAPGFTTHAAEQPLQDHSTQRLSLASLAEERLHPGLANVCCKQSAGKLVLAGAVPTFYLKQLAQEAASHVRGIHEVENNIRVTNGPVVTP